MTSFDRTVICLSSENDKLQQDLHKVEQLETKMTTEMAIIKEKIEAMEKELVVFSNIDALKESAEQKRKVGQTAYV